MPEQATSPNIIKIVDDIIVQAIDKGASDIHVEPLAKEMIIRYRVDGILQVVYKADKKMMPLIISRIKIMCQLDTTGLPRPQEGNIKFVYHEREVDLRVSIFPTNYGECVVMRLLESVKIYKNYEDLGFTASQAKLVEQAVHKTYGLILVTGPTGSGKSTTLFTMLDKLNHPEKNLVTLEDPIERKLEMVRQTQVNPEIGLSFASGLRYLLRQDPDVIMVGEIRDKETAQIAVQAAITGQLVLATIHTNNAAGAIVRLINMEVEPFLLASALRLVTAQRLARKNCPNCLQEYSPPAELLARIKTPAEMKFFHSLGCDACGQKGVRGRIGLHEVLVINKEIERLILKSPSDEEINEVARQTGMLSLRQAALEKVSQGIISLEEALRLTEEE